MRNERVLRVEIAETWFRWKGIDAFANASDMGLTVDVGIGLDWFTMVHSWPDPEIDRLFFLKRVERDQRGRIMWWFFETVDDSCLTATVFNT